MGRAKDWKFTWHGGPLTRISQGFVANVRPRLASGDWFIEGKVRIGPIKFEIVGLDGGLTFIARRLTPLWYLHLYNFGLFRWLRKVWRNIILTLNLWGLARTEPGDIPSWRDIGWWR